MKRRPERGVPILDAAPGEMLRRRGGDRDAVHVRRLPPIQLGDPLGGDAPLLEVRADAQRGDEWNRRLRQRADRRAIEVVVVIVRDDHRIEWRQRGQRCRRRMESLGAGERERRARCPHTGSVSTRTPSISMSKVECPSHVTRKPVSGRLVQRGTGSTSGSGPDGMRRSSPQRKSRIVGRSTPGFRPGETGLVFVKTRPLKRGDALILSARSPLDRVLLNDIVMPAPVVIQ